jgi:hypothetical protein
MPLFRRKNRKRRNVVESSKADFYEEKISPLINMAFTYPQWQHHAKMVKRSLTNVSIMQFSLEGKPEGKKNYPQQNYIDEAQKLKMGMTRLQQVHNGEVQHEIIRKLLLAQFTYPRWQRDVQESLEWYLRMQDTLAKEVVLNIVKKQRLHNGERSEYTSVLALLNREGSSTFSYEGWKKHKRMIEDTLTNTSNEVDFSFSANRKDVARDLYKGMIRLQRVHDGKASHDGIDCLHTNNNSFTYPRWKIYREEILILFLKFEDDEAKELYGVMQLKQDMHDGKRSHWLLTNLDAQSFTYGGWARHARSLEMALTGVFKVHLGQDRVVTAEKLLQGMRRLQKVFTGKTRHKEIEHLQKTRFTYTDYGKDKKEIMEYYFRFQDEYARSLQTMMLQKQRIHDGEVTDEIREFLAAFDNVNIESGQEVMTIAEQKKLNKKLDKATLHQSRSTGDFSEDSSESPRSVMRRLESKRLGSLASPVSNISHSSELDSLLDFEAPENKRLSMTLFSTAKGFKIDGSGFCKPNECSDQCYICTESRKNSGCSTEDYICLCARISEFDEKSSLLLDELSQGMMSN